MGNCDRHYRAAGLGRNACPALFVSGLHILSVGVAEEASYLSPAGGALVGNCARNQAASLAFLGAHFDAALGHQPHSEAVATGRDNRLRPLWRFAYGAGCS